MSAPEVAAIPVHECGEPLVSAEADGTLQIDSRRRDDAGAFAHLREGVLARLVRAQESLPDGLRLLFVEGYRPLSLQRAYFDGYAQELRGINPGWSPAEVHTAASRYVSPPEIAPHSAGAAVDLTLVTADGDELDMGTQLNDSPEMSDGACYTSAENVGAEARANRALLVTSLTAAGMVNYPTEWWHWSYGDRYWALVAGSGNAVYGPREL